MSVASKFLSAPALLGKYPPKGDLPTIKELWKKAFFVAWPSTVESFLVALVGMVDTIMVSNLGAYAIAAIGLTNQPKFIALAVFMSLNVAVSALVARRRGENDQEGANRVLVQAVLLTLILTMVITLLIQIFADPIIHMVGSQEDTHGPAVAYFRIIMGGLCFNAMNMVLCAAQRGIGNTKIAMKTNIISNLVNVALNYLLIEGHLGFPALGIQGAAIATVCGTIVALCMSLSTVLRHGNYLHLEIKRSYMRFDRRTLVSIFNIGSSSLAEQVFMRFGFLMYTILVAHLGTNPLAAHQIGMNIITISFAFGDGLSVAAVSLVGQNLGAGRPDLAKIYGGVCQRLGVCCSCMVAFVYFIWGKTIFGLFSQDAEILGYGSFIMDMVSLIVFLQIAQVIFSGCLRGSGDTKYVAMVSLISVAFIRPGSGWLFIYGLNTGLWGAWIGLALDQFVRLMLNFLRFRSGKWMNIKI